VSEPVSGAVTEGGVTAGTQPGGAAAAFSAHARDYEEQRRRLVPAFDAFYEAVTDVLGLREAPLRRVLDLGAGTGLLSAMVAAAHPEAELELLDGSEEMLDEARLRPDLHPSAVHVQDLRDPLPPGPFDAVVSALAIHHLEHDAKRELFAGLRECLRPGGVFVNAEQVAGPSQWLTDTYDELSVRQCRELGATNEELAAAWERMRYDRCADTESQLHWLRQAGFDPADVVFKSWRFAVLAAWRPPDARDLAASGTAVAAG